VVVLGACRTPLGSFQGQLAGLSAVQLGAAAIRGALRRAGVAAGDVEEVVMGNVLSAGVGQAPARQAALGAGLPPSACCTTVNKVCSSGLKAVSLAAQSVTLGHAEVVVAGGMESMSNAPYYLPKARRGFRLGHQQAVDGLLHDGLWDPYSDQHMGSCGELCAREKEVSREAQDDHALESLKRAARAQELGLFAGEIEPVEVKSRRGAATVDRDEALALGVQPDKVRGMRPAFEKGGTITAANASPLSDGAAALVLSSRAFAEHAGLKPLAVIRSYADFEQEPQWFTTAPAAAAEKALKAAGLAPSAVDFCEINEAFSVVDIVNRQALSLKAGKVNVHGGAVALGHPIGASGARILVTLLSVLQQHGGRTGLAAICNGGGGATALVVQREE